MIDLMDVIRLLDTGNWVSLAYLSYDAKKGTAGEIIRFQKCRYRAPVKPAVADTGRTISADKTTLRQNHHKHFTRNLILPNGQIRKVHLRLIFAINNQKVI